MWHYGVCESYHVSVGLCKAHRRARSSRKFEFLCPRRAYVVQRQNSNWGWGTDYLDNIVYMYEHLG